jgi:hypothetical protein
MNTYSLNPSSGAARGGGSSGRPGRGVRGCGDAQGGSGVQPSQPQTRNHVAETPDAKSSTASGPPPLKRPRKDVASSPYSMDNIPIPSPHNRGHVPLGADDFGQPVQTKDAKKKKKKSPAQSPFKSKGANDFINSGIFSRSGRSTDEELLQLFNSDTDLLDTPTKTNIHALKDLRGMLRDAFTDLELLDKLEALVEKASRGQTEKQRKEQLRKDVEPWIHTGLNYTGPKQQGLFLADGTRNPDRPIKGTGSRSLPIL